MVVPHFGAFICLGLSRLDGAILYRSTVLSNDLNAWPEITVCILCMTLLPTLYTNSQPVCQPFTTMCVNLCQPVYSYSVVMCASVLGVYHSTI